MKKTTFILTVTAVLLAVFASACGSPSAPASQAPQVAPPAVSQPTQNQPAAPAQSFAPVCQTTTASTCTAPAVSDTDVANSTCVSKIPYQNIMVPPGTTFESLDPKGELKCQDSGTVVDGKKVITCTGKQLWTYELKLTNSSCSAGNLATGTGQCQTGYGFDAAQNCCAPVSSGGGSVTIKVNLGGCP